MNKVEHTGDVRSPFSAQPPGKLRDLSKAFILEQLHSYYGVQPPDQIVETDYSLWQCKETGFAFAWPMLPGNTRFYEWLSGFASYYPGIRWEYGEVSRLVGGDGTWDGQLLKVVDVGCGKGDFLQALGTIPAGRKYALDLNPPAVRECRAKGFHSFCGTIEYALETGFFGKAAFPLVTSFHCLEHVADPIEFVRSLKQLAAPGGKIYVSTPYSPMSFEADWFDILNHPPHHLTRWNVEAYERLADLLGLRVRFYFPPSSTARRALNVFQLLKYGPHHRVAKPGICLDLLLHFPTFWRHFRRQSQFAKSRRASAADLILVELTVS